MPSNRIGEFSTNGRAKPAKPKPTKATARTAKLRQRVAIGIGGVGVAVLGLSIVHCSESIGLLTGSPWYLSALLAIGIDAGLVLSELAELVSEDATVKRWSRAYISLSVVLSMGLNAYAFGLHATVQWAGVALGLVLPVLVLLLGRIAGHLAK